MKTLACKTPPSIEHSVKCLDVYMKLILSCDIIVYEILSYIEYQINHFEIRELFGYFSNDPSRTIYQIYTTANLAVCSNLHNVIQPLNNIYVLTITQYLTTKPKIKYDVPIHNILRKFKNLVSLNIPRCWIITLGNHKRLKYLNLSGCNTPLGNYINLRRITIKQTNIINIPDYPNLVSLDIETCNKLKCIGSYPMLQNFSVYNCDRLSGIPDYENLTELNIGKCNNFKKIGCYPNLLILRIHECHNITKLGQHTNIELLNLKKCINIKEIDIYQCLKKIKLDQCHSLTGVSINSSLKYCRIEFCKNITKYNINCNTITKIYMSRMCVENIMTNISKYSYLETIVLSECYDIKNISGHTNIRSIELIYCNVTKIGNYPKLKVLKLHGCINIKEIGEMPTITHISLRGCFRLDIRKIKNYTSLTRLHIYSPYSINTTITHKSNINRFLANLCNIPDIKPNINNCSYDYLISIKGIGPKTAKNIIKHMPYNSYHKLKKKCKLRKNVWDMLILYTTYQSKTKKYSPRRKTIMK